jgi:ABC-type sugar transport system, periplasmic component
MVLGLVACGGNNSGKSTQSSDQASKETKKIVFWNLYYNTQNESDKDKSKDELFINKAAKKFEEQNSGITVEILTPPMDNYFNMLKAACVAKNGPDISMNWTGGPLMDYVQFMMPLDKYYTKDEISKLTGWDMCRKDYKPDGEIMAVPVGMNGGVFVIYYNKALFEKAGLDREAKPETWDDFMAMCEKLKQAGITPFIDGGKEGWNMAWLLGQIWYDYAGFDGLVAFREGKSQFSTDSSLKDAYAVWKKVYDSGYTNTDEASLAQADGQAKFLAGEGAMEVGWSNISKDVVTGLGDDAGYFPIPHVKGSKYANTYLGGFAGYCFSVSNFSKLPEESVKYIKYMTSKETQDWFVDETQFDLPNNVDAAEPQFKTNPVMKWMWSYIKTSGKTAAINWDNILQGDLNQEIYNMSGAIITGKISIDDAMKKFDEKYAAITKK